MTYVPDFFARADKDGVILIEPVDYTGNAHYVYGERLSILFGTDVVVEGAYTNEFDRAVWVSFTVPAAHFVCHVEGCTVLGFDEHDNRFRLRMPLITLEQQEAISELLENSPA